MSSHGTQTAIALHHSRNEPLCSACRQYLNRLQGEAFGLQRDGDEVLVTVAVPRSVFWRLEAIAEDEGAEVAHVLRAMAIARVPVGRTITFEQEKQIRALWLQRKSIAEIARTVNVTKNTVSTRVARWKRPRERKTDGTEHADHGS